MYKHKFIKKIVLFSSMLLLLFVLPLSHSIKSYAASDIQKVYDNASLLTDEESSELEDLCNEYGDEVGTDIFIITTDTLDGQTRKEYIDDFYDNNVYSTSIYEGNAAFLLINMEEDNRGFEIRGYGDNSDSPQFYLSNDRINSMISDIKPLLHDGNYYDAMTEYINQVYNYAQIGPDDSANNNSSDYNSDNYDSNSYDDAYYNNSTEESIFQELWFQILISLGIGAISVGIMAYNSGGRVSVDEDTYIDHNHSKILAKSDDYIRTSITRTRKPQNNDNNSGGGSSGGSSSGGHSSSGGGSSF